MRYDNPNGIIAGAVVMEVIAVASVGLRFCTRYLNHSPVLISDRPILIALILAAGFMITEINGVVMKGFA